MSQIHKYETVQEDGGFKPKQPQRIISGLRETFIKRCIAERTNEAEIKPEEQSEIAESCREKVWDEIQLKGPQRQKQTQEQNKKEWASSAGRSGQAQLVYVKDKHCNISIT